jgi:hypothetical protein
LLAAAQPLGRRRGHFTDAIATSEHWGTPPFMARARYWADMLVKRGEPLTATARWLWRARR